jgi:hypothetical protein
LREASGEVAIMNFALGKSDAEQIKLTEEQDFLASPVTRIEKTLSRRW